MLPNDPSELIRLAIADLEKVEKDSRYEVDMGTWHYGSGAKCFVCLAGSVMAGTLGTDASESLVPGYFSDDDRNRLHALNCFRAGDISYGLGLLGIYSPAWRRTIWPYGEDPDRFKRDMLELADFLETYLATK